MSIKVDMFKAKLNKKFGDVIKSGSELPDIHPIWASTGSLKLDSELRIGGIPKNSIVEIYGAAHSGKSFLALNLVKELQKKRPEKYVLYINTERILDKKILAGMGINPDTFIQMDKADYDAVFLAIEEGIKTEEFPYIIIDSVAAIITSSESESDYGDAMMAQLARAMSLGVKKINNILASDESGTTVIFLNQVRTNVGQKYGDTDIPTGGMALGFYSQLRIKVWRGKVVKGTDDNPEAFELKMKIVKNKLGRPFGRADTVLHIGQEKWGLDEKEEIVDLAIEYEIPLIKKSGAWIEYINGDKTEKFQGKEKFQNFLNDNPDEFERVKEAVKKTIQSMGEIKVEGSFDEVMKGK